jgi:hypothetical protein
MPQSASRFVILRHEQAGAVHWDLMLEAGESLTTWQLLEDPRRLASAGDTTVIPARRIGDHRKAYLDCEGPVSRNRGHVTRLDRGTYEPIDTRREQWTVRLAGSLFGGVFRLEKGQGANEDWRIQRLD